MRAIVLSTLIVLQPLLFASAQEKKLTIPVDISNYTAMFTFGSNNNIANLQLSMLNDWTFVMGSDCKNCAGRIYDYTASATFKLGKNQKASLQIGKQKDTLTLEGFSSFDDMCLGVRPNQTSAIDAQYKCMNSFEFFTVTKMSSDIFFDDVAGELGLGFDLPDNGPSFISALKSAGYIDKELVAVHIDTGNQSTTEDMRSQVTIGGIETRFLTGPSQDFVTYPVRNNKWAVEIRGHSFQGQQTELKFKSTAKIDSFARGIQLPTNNFLEFAAQLKSIYRDNEDFQCNHYKCFFFDDWCSEAGIMDKIGNFTLRLTDSYGYTISPKLFMIEGLYSAGAYKFKTCEVQIFNNLDDQEEYILGDIFSDAYYVQYDYTTQTVGFNGYMLTDLPVLGEKNERQSGMPIWAVIIIAIVVMAVLSCLIICYINKKKSARLRNLLGEYEDGETGEKQKKNIHEVDLDDY